MRYLLILLLLASCGPSDGDVYENKLTQERVKIDVDDCYRLVQKQTMWNDIEEGVQEEMRGEGHRNYNAIEDGDFKVILDSFKDSTATCIGYTVSIDHPTIIGAKGYKVIPEDKFTEDYQPIN